MIKNYVYHMIKNFAMITRDLISFAVFVINFR